MLADLGIENAGLTDQQLEAAVVRFDAMFGWNGLPANDRHEILFRFAKAGGLPWLALLDEIYRSVADE
jgi:hypothetical protein